MMGNRQIHHVFIGMVLDILDSATIVGHRYGGTAIMSAA